MREDIEQIIAQAEQYEGIIGTHDYPGVLVASLCAEKWGFSFTSVESILRCQHKYYFRKHLQQAVPEATPTFFLVDDQDADYTFPLFLKPIKSSFSRYAQVIQDQETLFYVLNEGLFDPSYLQFFNEIFSEYTGIETNANSYMAEGLLIGHQVSLEGYVYNNTVEILGIIDAILHEGTLSFERFIYPSSLPNQVQRKMHQITIKAVRSLGLNNTLFSVELMYDPLEGTISIIEINPRISAQFADFFKQVHGVNSYEILLALTFGQQPPTLGNGEYSYAGSFPLRLFEDQKVVRIPTPQELEQICTLFPDVLIQCMAQEGQQLSEVQQDGNSYLYAILNIAAHSKQELEQKRDQLVSLLPFVFESVD